MKHLLRIIKFTGTLWRYYVGVSIFTILIAAMTQFVPLLTKATIDQVTGYLSGGKIDVNKIILYAVLIFATDIGQTLFSNFGGFLGDMLAIKQQRILSNRYYTQLMSLPQRYFDTELTGKIINRMSRGIQQISDFTQTMSNNFLQFIFSTVFTLIIVAFYSWQVALMLLTLYPAYIYLTARSSNKWQSYQEKVNENLDYASGRFAEGIGQIKVVKSFVREDYELTMFDRFYSKVVGITRPQSRYWHSQDILRRVVLAIINFVIYLYIFYETAHRVYSIGEMVLLIQYAQLIRIPLFSISFLVDRTQRAISNTKDYFDVMDEKPEISDISGAKELILDKGAVAFKDVVFGYDESVTVLNGISFKIDPDTKVALVGESGEGKTTITSLMLRLYDVTSGQILIDGQSIHDVTQSSLRRNIGVVFQEPALFSGTVRENIAYANPKVSEAQIIAAAKAANADEFINKFEKKYDTEIGERGLKLSGGQKQRIAIARALLKDAPILILDEATSSLDTKSERKVQEALERLMHGRTTLIIAHRLSTIQSVDKIITLKNGSVDEIGTPQELAASGGIYAQLLAMQGHPSEETAKKLKEYEIEEG
jgi:ATP-binding cassette subfamily B protein